MLSATHRFLVLVAVLSAYPPSGHSEITAPRVGQTAMYECQGVYAKQWRDTVVEVKDGVVRYDSSIDEKKQWRETPIRLIGTTLFIRRDRNDGRGIAEQWFDSADFSDFEQLEPGTQFQGIAWEWHQQGNWVWNYSIRVGELMTIENKVLGNIDVVEITEKRDTPGRHYWSDATFYLYPQAGLVYRWIYEDPKGTSECELTKLE